jgi:SAM-dependent methyltransferase
MIGKIIAGVGLYTAATYTADVLFRPAVIAARARTAANRRNKPLLNIGAGTRRSSLRAALLGPTLWGDVNIDIAAPRAEPTPDTVVYGDAHDLSEWPDKHFGAVVASHVLEHLEDPAGALEEWRRVADEVFVIVPKAWAPPHMAPPWTPLAHR